MNGNTHELTEEQIREIAREEARDVAGLEVEDDDTGERWSVRRFIDEFELSRREALQAIGLVSIGVGAQEAVARIFIGNAEAAAQDNMTVPGTLDAGTVDAGTVNAGTVNIDNTDLLASAEPSAALDDTESLELAVRVPNGSTLEVYRWGAFQVTDGTAPTGLDCELLDGSDTVQASENTANTESDAAPVASHTNSSGTVSVFKLRAYNGTGAAIGSPGVSFRAIWRVA